MAKKNSFNLTGLNVVAPETRTPDEILGINQENREAMEAAPQKVAQPKKAKKKANKNAHLITFSSEKEWQTLKDISAATNQNGSRTISLLMVAFQRGDMRWIKYVFDKYQAYIAAKPQSEKTEEPGTEEG